MTASVITRALRIHGKVQGVTFRASSKEKADELGLAGWVKNNPDGTVSCEVCGAESDVDAFVEWCKEGPRYARVEEVRSETVSDACPYETFEIRY
jgi:acylphosphatase